jgi:hypothetical protein
MEKMIFVVCVTVIVILLSFALGTAFGSSVTHSDFIETLIPLFSMLGVWVSGLGTLGAVLAALWIAEKQKKDDIENLHISFDFMIFAGLSEEYLTVRVVSNGRRPSNVTSIVLSSPSSTVNIMVREFHRLSHPLPINLSYGVDAVFIFCAGFEEDIASYIKHHCSGSAEGLELNVISTIKNYKVNISPELIKSFQKLADG